MNGVNKVILVGRLGEDPEVKKIKSGNFVTTLTLATCESFTTNEGREKHLSEWHKVVVLGRAAELCKDYLKKGQDVYIEGKIRSHMSKNEKGDKIFSSSILADRVTFLGKKK